MVAVITETIALARRDLDGIAGMSGELPAEKRADVERRLSDMCDPERTIQDLEVPRQITTRQGSPELARRGVCAGHHA